MTRIIIGPRTTARRYAKRQQWNDEDYLVVADAETLRSIDPPDIELIVNLNAGASEAIDVEIDNISSLWPIAVVNA